MSWTIPDQRDPEKSKPSTFQPLSYAQSLVFFFSKSMIVNEFTTLSRFIQTLYVLE